MNFVDVAGVSMHYRVRYAAVGVREIANLIPGSRFEIIAGTGHIPCVEQPEAHASLILGFIASLPGRNP